MGAMQIRITANKGKQKKKKTTKDSGDAVYEIKRERERKWQSGSEPA